MSWSGGFKTRGPIAGAGSGASGIVRTLQDLGMQIVDTKLEEDLVVQLAFCLQVEEVLCHPVIPTLDGAGTFCPDVLVTTRYDHREEAVFTFLVNVRGDGDARPIEDLEEAASWCRAKGARLRTVGAREIRTPYLGNARRIAPHAHGVPEGMPDALTSLCDMLEDGPKTFGEARRTLSVDFR